MLGMSNLSILFLLLALPSSSGQKYSSGNLRPSRQHPDSNKYNLEALTDFMEEENEFWTRSLQFSTSMTISSTRSPSPSASPSSSSTTVCNLPTQTRKNDMLAIVATISEQAAINDSSSPQGQAFNWLVDDDPLALCPDDADAIKQRFAMAAVYFSTGAAKDAKQKFLSDQECSWPGVTCSSGGAVFVLDINKQPLGGSIPPEIGQLTSLRVIKMEENKLTGSIPESIGNLQNLIAVDFNDNKMTGSIPESLYSLLNLQQIDIDKNSFTGTLSASIDNLASLLFLQLENNKFTGTIPETLGSLTALEQATFDKNLFTGTMPASVCANRGDGTTGGELIVLNADCPPQFECSCCTIIC